MSPLRQDMIRAMEQRGFSPRTHESYLYAVKQLARYSQVSPDRLTTKDLQGFLDYLVQERKLSPASCRLYLNAIRFLYVQVLGWPGFEAKLVVPKRTQRIPELLTRREVQRILAACTRPTYRTLLSLTYGCGLRASETVALKVQDIDGEREWLRIEQGKGAKDRLVTLSPTLVEELRRYWQCFRPTLWLFPNPRHPEQHLDVQRAQRAYTQAKRAAGITKTGGIHSLRHAYATHQLERGLPVHELKRLLGHGHLETTMRYVHWLPGGTTQGQPADLMAEVVAHD